VCKVVMAASICSSFMFTKQERRKVYGHGHPHTCVTVPCGNGKLSQNARLSEAVRPLHLERSGAALSTPLFFNIFFIFLFFYFLVDL